MVSVSYFFAGPALRWTQGTYPESDPWVAWRDALEGTDMTWLSDRIKT